MKSAGSGTGEIKAEKRNMKEIVIIHFSWKLKTENN